jgi:ribosomal protein L7/L12
VGVVVFFPITLVAIPPRVSTPSESGVASKSKISFISPEIPKINEVIKKTKTKVEVANLTKEQIQSVLKLCRDTGEGYLEAKKALDQAIIALKSLSGEMLKVIKPQIEKMDLDTSEVSEIS